MRIVVFGVGAIGGWLAAGLARGGQDVALLARGATLAALRQDGLVLVEGERVECFRLQASDDPAELEGPDILLLAVKAHLLPELLPAIRKIARPHTLILPAVNGIPWWFFQQFGGPSEGLVLQSVDPGGALAASFPAERVIGCVVHGASRIEAPGRIRLVKADRLLLGAAARAEPPALAALCDTFRAGGIPTQQVANIRAEAWAKLWGNSNMNPLSVLARADAAQLLDDAGVRGLVLAMMREMAALGERIGLPLAGDPEERVAVTRRLGAFRTSMLQDLEAGRSLELAPILGVLVELAARLGVEAPTLAGVHGLTRLLARNLGLAQD